MLVKDLFEVRDPLIPKSWQHAFDLAKEHNLELVKPEQRGYAPHLSIASDLIKTLNSDTSLRYAVQLSKYPTHVTVRKLSDFPNAITQLNASTEAIKHFLKDPTKIIDITRPKFYEWLQEAYKNSNSDRDVIKLKQQPQLYMPRSKMHADDYEEDLKTKEFQKGRWIWDFDDKGEVHPAKKKEYGVSEALHGAVLPGHMISRKGGTKPWASAFWTSSAYKKDNKWTSRWVEYAKEQGRKDWFHTTGFLYKVAPSARILVVNGQADAHSIIEAYNLYTGDLDQNYYDDISGKFPWDLLPLHWDAIHVPSPWKQDDFLRDWDVESTVWFSDKSLQLLGKVPINLNDSNSEY